MAKEENVTFKSNKKEVFQELNLNIDSALFAAGQAWDGYTKDLTPVRTGNLRKGWRIRVNKEKKYVELGSSVRYAPFVELGSVHNKAQHMLRDGLMNNINEIKSVMKKRLGRLS